ncbi:TRAP transporter large permease subunit [Spirochaeta lutea]|uniref:TRAP C4-dicarboxylate transport system permease DctM subunit domain-containing protein n=1 Tax=Spirochaeta lutea TaxID=1480694 RepID=A0A098R4A2_9SPIO|nr:TRAP transporter large permease subunit [Spirochaeta lutea]KGE73592.1 hypothetical protein DC28_02780 [Spirochaeta lutea]
MKLRFDRIPLGLGVILFVLLVSIPFVDMVFRFLTGGSIPGLYGYIPLVLLTLTAIAAVITSKRKEHLSMGLEFHGRIPIVRELTEAVRGFMEVIITVLFLVGSISFIYVAVGAEEMGGFLPMRFYTWFLPPAFLLVLFYWFKRFEYRSTWVVGGVAVGIGIFLALPAITNLLYAAEVPLGDGYFVLEDFWYQLVPGVAPFLVVILIVSVFLGTPIFIALGGTAVLLFAKDWMGPEIIALEGISMLRDTSVPAIALFTLAGYLLSESKAGKRLVLVFKSLFGWVPGGMVLAAVLVSAFFTTFTGASGVTILALGGLLHIILQRSGRLTPEASLGVITSSSNIGLLFPPSLAIILYASISQIPVNQLFAAGVGPGLVFIAAMAGYGVVYSIKHKVPIDSFKWRRALQAIRLSLWELALPVVIIALYFSGLATLVETSAAAVVYVFIVEVLIRKEIEWKLLVKTAERSLSIIGGVLIILMVARGLSSYIVDAGIPQMLTSWVTGAVKSPLVFLLLLNLALLIVGCFMDLFSAIFVVVPLILPLGAEFGIAPIHLGMIFLANLGLGFITPPVGLNLFLASYRFEQRLSHVYKSVMPFFIIQLGVVLLITYVPWFSLALVSG